MRHHFGKGVAAGLRLPVGKIEVVPRGGRTSVVSGLGDLELSVDYELGRVWGLRGRRPSVRLRPVLRLPTGESARIDDPNTDAPPNLVAVGQGVVSPGGDILYTQPILSKLSAHGWLGFRAPLGYSENDIRFGWVMSYGGGVLYRAAQRVLAEAAVVGSHRARSENRFEGPLLNSGGDLLSLRFGLTVFASEKVTFGVSGRGPVYTRVEGVQIAQSFGVSAFVALMFGAHDKHAEHDHHGHQHGEGAHEHKGAEQDGSGGDEPVKGGDVADLARGGKSFSIADAVVPGKIVAIDFWATWCEPCKSIEALLDRYAATNPGLVVRKVEVPSFETPVAIEHLRTSKALPIVWLIDEHGRVAHRLDAVRIEELQRHLDQLLAPTP